ncbi:unnamed protein product, partial [Iphiclides podalirius]
MGRSPRNSLGIPKDRLGQRRHGGIEGGLGSHPSPRFGSDTAVRALLVSVTVAPAPRGATRSRVDRRSDASSGFRSACADATCTRHGTMAHGARWVLNRERAPPFTMLNHLSTLDESL